MSNLKKWDFIYSSTSDDSHKISRYGEDLTYLKGWKFLKDCTEIEDWGCGFGYFSNFVPIDRYKGIDGSCSKAASVYADLEEYKSRTSGIFMRHILEHNENWEKVLANAIASFRHRMVLIIFTPFADETKQIGWNPLHEVPNISFKKEDLTKHFDFLEWEEEEGIKTDTEYGVEHIFYISKHKLW